MRARVLFALVLFAGSLHATTVQRLGLEDLVKRAHAIVSGRVVGARTYWSSNRKLIYTNYTILVDESIKGNAGRSIEVTTIGGKIGDIELHVAGMPSFQTGENAIVFVEQSGGFQIVLGLGQGKFTVANGEVINNLGDLSFPDGHPGSPTRMPVQNFKDQIHKILSR